MKKVIVIDTNREDHNRFKSNLELYNLIEPMVVAIIDDNDEVFTRDDINFTVMRENFERDGSIHCVLCHGKSSLEYTSIADLRYMIVEGDDDEIGYVETLSELCDELAEKYDISSWKPKII